MPGTGGNGGKGAKITDFLALLAQQEEFPRLSEELKKLNPQELTRLGDMLNQELIKIETVTESEDVITGGESGGDITDS